jgi:hypothetical protein
VTEADYQTRKQQVVDALVALLQCADELGKDQQLVAAEVLIAFQQAAEALV